MANKDTIHLLRECDAGTKMAVASFDDVLDKIKNADMKQLMVESREHHETLGDEIHALLLEYHSDEKEPNPMAKGMSWLKTNMKLTMDECDATIADLMTDGCNMGVKSLNKYLNQYPTADTKVKNICERLIKIEEKLGEDLRKFL